MQYKTFILNSRLPAETAIARLADLLAKAEVEYKVEGLSISSTRTPIVIFNLQRALYSHRNWVGLSPFPFISGVNMRCRPGKSGLTDVIVEVNRARTLFYVGYCVWTAGMASVAAPTLVDALLIIAASVPIAWISHVTFIGGYLLTKEITNSLKA